MSIFHRPSRWRLRPHIAAKPAREAPRTIVLVPGAQVRHAFSAALDSVLRQREVRFEVVVLDDGDRTALPPDLDAGHQDAVTFIRGPLARGRPALFNLVLADTRADYLFSLPAGSAFASDRALADLIHALDAVPTAALALSMSAAARRAAPGGSGPTRSPADPSSRGSTFRRFAPPALFNAVLRGRVTPGAGALARCAAIRELGGLDARFPTTGEELLWLRLLLVHDAVHVPGPIIAALPEPASDPALPVPPDRGSEQLAMLHELNASSPQDPRVRRALDRAISAWLRRRSRLDRERSPHRSASGGARASARAGRLVQDAGNG